MPDRTQDIKNLRAVATACKNYTDKSIDNLRWELGTYDLGVESDNTSALIKTMPSGTIKLNVNKIYGASEVSENLAVLSDVVETTNKGITYKIKDGIITLNGTSTEAGNIVFLRNLNCTLRAGSYTLNVFNTTFDFETYGGGLFIGTGDWDTTFWDASNTGIVSKNISSTTTLTTIRLYVENGVTFNNVQFKPMLVSGSTAPTEFSVGYTGIHNIELTGLKVEGSNKFNNFIIESGKYPKNDGTYENNSSWNCYEFKAKPSTSYTISGIVNSSVNSYFNAYNGDTFISAIGTFENGTYTTPANTTKVIYGVRNNEINNIMINEGSTALPYEPYVSTTKTIDLSTILYNGNPLFEGNSLKAVGTAKDYITPYKAHKQMILVDLGTLYYSYVAGQGSFNSGTISSIIKKEASGSVIANCLCPIYTTITAYQAYTAQIDMGIGVNEDGNVFISNSNYTSASDLKTAMSGIYALFELETPIEVSIDWSSTLRNIQGYPNGSIIAENTHNMDTTSEIDYLVEEVKA